jgi:AraC-like DNA-binding protein
MKYKRIKPPAYLKDYVRYFWTMESDGIEASPKAFRIIADGRPGLIFQQSENGTFYDQNDKQWPRFFLYGQATKHAQIYLPAKFSAIGVYFYPSALKSIFGFNADEFTDSCLDLSLMPEKQGLHLSERLLNTSSISDRIELISAFLFFQIRRNSAPADRPVEYALSQIIQSNGNIALRKLQEPLGLSERGLERKFKQGVGISPKLFSRICRFQASLRQLRNNDYDKLSDVAFENDYADQSHFIRAFNEFAGFSPKQYQKQFKKVIEKSPALLKELAVGFVLF